MAAPSRSLPSGSNGEASARYISQLVIQLVSRLVPGASEENGAKTKLAQYVLRILGSRIPPSSINDEYALISLMKKHLVNTSSVKEAIELENKYNHLNKLKSFAQLKFAPSATSHSSATLKFSMLYMLYQLRNTNSPSSLTGGQQSVLTEPQKHFLLANLELQPAPLALPPKSTLSHEPSTNLPMKELHSKRLDALPEHKIVRDLVFVLQGLEGEFFKYNPNTDRFELSTSVKVSRSERILAQRIAELGSLFSKVRLYLERTQVSNSSVSSHLGLIAQSFREGVAEEVTTYYRMISVLEAQVNAPASKQNSASGDSSNVSSQDSASTSRTGEDGSGMTLRKLAVWTSEPLRRMKWLYMVIENDMGGSRKREGIQGQESMSKSAISPELSSTSVQVNSGVASSGRPSASHDMAASRMHQLTQLRAHGDPYLQSLGKTLETYTSRPVLTMIQNWIFQGTLSDPYKEFFIIKNDAIVPRVRGEIGAPSKLDHTFWIWAEQYLVLYSRIPPFISHKLAHKIMVIGKSINFMKACCGDADWIAQHTRKILSQHIPADGVSNFDQLRQPIHLLYDSINARLVHLIKEKFFFMENVETIRNYLFLGQGDLTHVLMESLQDELSLPVGKQYRHNLLPIVDGALRASIANAWPSYLQDCCEVYLPNPKELQRDMELFGETRQPEDGWDVFELSYKLKSPLDAIFGSLVVVNQHRAIHRFLWRLRRIQIILSGTWRLATNCTRQLTGLVPEIVPLLQQVHLLRHQMSHFTSNIQYYIMFEVIETAWQAFQKQVSGAKSLDEIIAGYTEYVSSVIKSSLVDDPNTPRPSVQELVDQGIEPEQTPALMIWEILEIIRDFDGRVSELYSVSHEVAVRRQTAQNAEPELDEDGQPQWGITPEDEQADADFIDHLDNVLIPGIETVSDQYKHTFDQLFVSLAHRMREGDNVYLRNLFQRINFNSFYASESQAHIQANAESATATLQATLASMKESASAQSISRAPGLFSPASGGSASRAAVPHSSLGSMGPPSITSPNMPASNAANSAAYTETLLKQAAAKLRLMNLTSSAHQRSASSTKPAEK